MYVVSKFTINFRYNFSSLELNGVINQPKSISSVKLPCMCVCILSLKHDFLQYIDKYVSNT